MLFALTFGFSSLSISYANFDFQGDVGADSLTGDDDNLDNNDKDDKDDLDCNDYDDADDLGGCSDKKLSKIDKKTGLPKHITLCKDTMCPNVGIIEDCKKAKKLDKYLSKGFFLQTEFVQDNDGDGLHLEGSEVVACESPGDNYIVKEGAEVDCDDSIASGSSCVAGQNQCGDDLIGENQCVDGAIACANVVDIPEPTVEVFLYANNDGDSASVNNGSEQRLDCNEDGQPDSGLGPNEGLEPLAEEDCNDNDSSIYPGAPELCSTQGVDNNCDGNLDDVEGLSTCVSDANVCGVTVTRPQQCINNQIVCDTSAPPEEFITTGGYIDQDSDGVCGTTVLSEEICPGDPATPVCAGLDFTGPFDCDDLNPDAQDGVIGADEIPGDNIDNNCNGLIDESSEPTGPSWGISGACEELGFDVLDVDNAQIFNLAEAGCAQPGAPWIAAQINNTGVSFRIDGVSGFIIPDGETGPATWSLVVNGFCIDRRNGRGVGPIPSPLVPDVTLTPQQVCDTFAPGVNRDACVRDCP